MEKFTKILETIDGYVWGIPLIVLIIAVGIFLTFRLRLLQIFHLPKALKFMFQNANTFASHFHFLPMPYSM